MKKIVYDELMELNKGYINTFNALYNLKTFEENEIDKIYQDIKLNLIETKILFPDQILEAIGVASKFNNKYLKSYWAIFKKLFEEYRPNKFRSENSIINYFVYKEYGHFINKRDLDLFNVFEKQNISLDVHESNTIFRAIMDDNKILFISFIESEGFNDKMQLSSMFYPDKLLSLLELCCYHGAVNCFKLLRTKFKSTITQRCLHYSFLGGNPDIMNECMKEQNPDKICMRYAIISHNIDFVSFLMNEHNIEIDLDDCLTFKNLHALFVNFDQKDDINTFFLYSSTFNIPSLCEYLLLQGADVNTRNDEGLTALHFAARENCPETTQFLILHNADINVTAKLMQLTALDIAVMYNYVRAVEVLLLNGANANAKAYDGSSMLHMAAGHGSKETAELLISHGAEINAKDNNGATPLHIAAQYNFKDMAELLVSHGAVINAKDYKNMTPFYNAIYGNCIETTEYLKSLGAKI
ncbi:ankyrin repeat protein, putative [Trichomonas vaginalis G3]|uniref:Ankyrin repeat protein, putative n=1 Tax=Trichomonas vaginalis (strain ATCC PRA-98 / G3) TaxID=412133 RepID=A2DBY7_TRIV3|nr:spectrin binding [Trichomonas vaginalis G3]EAY22028.1 ankyrin repeat protein, putative [Trichomonas vaginalis G3]KAI5525347.1 spectrin binding [Trichomonas vaginalis G3]|eukprot:XP_001583014.1 ankyrin repeat protein [Trichomonas vaginalis G3]